MMRKAMLRLWHDEQGQSTTEYILILAIVVMIAMRFRGIFQQKLEQLMQNVGGQLDKATQPDQ